MEVVIYTKDDCNWCVKAKQLMNQIGMKYTERKLGVDYTREDLRDIIPENLPLKVPQIFVDSHRIGGYEDFAEWCDNHGYGNE